MSVLALLLVAVVALPVLALALIWPVRRYYTSPSRWRAMHPDGTVAEREDALVYGQSWTDDEPPAVAVPPRWPLPPGSRDEDW